MAITLSELATKVSGTLVGGEPTQSVNGAATLDSAAAGDITLVDAADKLHLLAKSRAGAAIVPTPAPARSIGRRSRSPTSTLRSPPRSSRFGRRGPSPGSA